MSFCSFLFSCDGSTPIANDGIILAPLFWKSVNKGNVFVEDKLECDVLLLVPDNQYVG